MILTLDEYKMYLPLNAWQTASQPITEAHETRALYKWFPKYLGNTLTDAIAGDSPDEDLLLKVKPVLANLTFLEAMPFLNLVLTGSGFGIISNQNMAPASTERIKALAGGLLEAAHNYLDNMLAFLEDEVETYTDWNQCSLNTGSLIADAETFDDKLKINESRVAFITLIPYIKQVEALKISSLISSEFLQELIAGSDANVKPLIQSACAYWAWHLMMDAKEEPATRNLQPATDYLHTSKKLLYHKINPMMAPKIAEEYMIKAIEYLNNNLTTYTTYNDYAYEAPYENKAENGFFIT